MKSIVIRGISGTVYVAVVLGALLLDKAAFAAVMAAAMLVSVYEFYRMAKQLDAKPQVALGLACSAALFAGCFCLAFDFFSAANNAILYAVVPLASLIFFVELFSHRKNPFHNIAYTLLGVVYVALPFALTNLIVDRAGTDAMLCFFVLLWANDTFAYLFGISLGRHKLLPSVSPKKSWEGYIGGILSVVAFSFLLPRFTQLEIAHVVVMALIISVTAVLGDLVESQLKRSAGVKDSGRIMPGHGGLLDRFDAALLSLPLVWVYVQLAI
jgi:phosphatidate cytidylyltransferase